MLQLLLLFIYKYSDIIIFSFVFLNSLFFQECEAYILRNRNNIFIVKLVIWLVIDN